MAKSSSTAPPKLSEKDQKMWQARRDNLPRLQSRAQNLIHLILGGLKVSKGSVILPEDVVGWFNGIYKAQASNNYEEFVELFEGNIPFIINPSSSSFKHLPLCCLCD